MKAVLRSNRGGEFLAIEYYAIHNCGPEKGVDCIVTIQSSSWDGGEPKPVSANLGTRHISLIELALLKAGLSEWLKLPLAKLAKVPFESKHPLDFTGEHKLCIEFGARGDTIDSGKPIVTVSWKLESFMGAPVRKCR